MNVLSPAVHFGRDWALQRRPFQGDNGEMKIISASRRTDIPAFYAPWFMNRIRAGYVRVRNPFNYHQVSTVGLLPRQVACILFWTKDPRPLFPHLEELESLGHRFLFHVTITGMPDLLEPSVPPPGEIADAVRELAGRVGSDRIVWRFDPILLSDRTPEATTLENFSRLSESLQGSLRRVTVSFARYYRQIKPRLRRAGIDWLDTSEMGPEDARSRIGPLANSLAETAVARGMEIVSCAAPIDLSPFGIHPGACIDSHLLRRIFGISFDDRKDPGQRPECRCIPSIDIGAYGSCRHDCLYCYASRGHGLQNRAVHDPGSPFLLGKDAGEEDQGLFG